MTILSGDVAVSEQKKMSNRHFVAAAVLCLTAGMNTVVLDFPAYWFHHCLSWATG